MTNRGELIIERKFNAPVELLWEVHSDPSHLLQWWKPSGFQMEVMKMDFTPGGLFHYCLDNGSGFQMWGLIKYTLIEKPNRMEFINSFSNQNEDIIRHPMADTWPLRVQNVLTFEPLENESLLRLQSWPLEATEIELQTWIGGHDSVRGGFKGTLNQLEGYLAQLSS